MFGSKEASEDKLKKMVEKGKWDKLRKTVSGFGQDNAGSACKSLCSFEK